MRHFLFILFLLLLTFFSAAQKFDNLKVEQPLISDLFLWGNHILAETVHDTANKYYYIDSLTNRLLKLEIEDNSKIIHVAQSNSFLFAITKKNGHLNLLSKEKRKTFWLKQELLIKSNAIDNAKFVATDNLLVLVTSEIIHYKLFNSTWKSIEISKLIKLHPESDRLPRHCLLKDDALYLGYDNGEWGGSLIEIPFSVGDDIVFKTGNLILNENIVAINYSKDSILWIATGLSHLGLAKSGIYKYQNDKLQKVLLENPKLSLKGESDLSAFCLNNNDEPFFIASEFGLFKIQGDCLRQLINEKLIIYYPIKDYIVGSYPVGMYIDREGNIFIASRSLGVLVYKKLGNQYTFSQMIFN